MAEQAAEARSDTQPDRLVSTKDLARYTGSHKCTILRWVREGKLPKPFTFGNQYRWHESDLMEFFKTDRPIV